MDAVAVRVEHFDEAAHVRAFEMMRQFHEHADQGTGSGYNMGCVADLDGKPQSGHPDLIDAQFTIIRFVLFIVQVWRGEAF